MLTINFSDLPLAMEENDTSMGHLEGSRLRLKAIEKPNLGKVDNHLNETWWPEGKQSWKGVFYSERGIIRYSGTYVRTIVHVGAIFFLSFFSIRFGKVDRLLSTFNNDFFFLKLKIEPEIDSKHYQLHVRSIPTKSFSPPKLLRLNDWKLNELRNSSGNGFSWPPGCKLFCAKDYYAKTILLLFSFFPSVLFSLLGGQSEMGTTYYVLYNVHVAKFGGLNLIPTGIWVISEIVFWFLIFYFVPITFGNEEITNWFNVF